MPITTFLNSLSAVAQTLDASQTKERARLIWEHIGGGVGDQDVIVALREDWGLTVVANQRIEPRKVVRVHEGGSVYHAVVLASWPRQSGFEIELAFADKGLRREARVAARGRAEVETSGVLSDQAIHADVLNVSAGGMQLLCDRAIAHGETTRVLGEGVEKLCRVRYCVQVTGGFRVGLQFCEGLAEAESAGAAAECHRP